MNPKLVLSKRIAEIRQRATDMVCVTEHDPFQIMLGAPFRFGVVATQVAGMSASATMRRMSQEAATPDCGVV